MVPPKSESHQTKFIEQCGPGVKNMRCAICNVLCDGGRRIIESKYIDNNLQQRFSTPCTNCKTDVVCWDCWFSGKCCERKKNGFKKFKPKSSEHSNNLFLLTFGVVVVIIAPLSAYMFFKTYETEENVKELERIINDEYYNLRSKFPDQQQELWGNVLRVMHNSDTVTTLTFLYEDDPSTSDCLADEVAFSYSRIQNRSFNRESVFDADNQVNDFGTVLEEYGLKVEKTNLLIVKHLHEISGNVARVFHTLCDTITPKVAPSVYIFTLR